MNKIKLILASLAVMMSVGVACAGNSAYIEVTGTATLNIIPDRITVEIGIEEYFRPLSGDPIHGVVTLDGNKAVVTITGSTWEYLPAGTKIEFERSVCQ